MNYATAHKELVSRHNTMSFLSDIGRVSVRKNAGCYIVRAENFESQHVSSMSFATLRGAMIAADELKKGWL